MRTGALRGGRATVGKGWGRARRGLVSAMLAAAMIAAGSLGTPLGAVSARAPAFASADGAFGPGTPGVAVAHASVTLSALAALAPNTTPGATSPAPLAPDLMPLPGDLPVPAGAAAGGSLAAPSGLAADLPASPAPASSFLALGDDNSVIPPDTHGAAGPAHVMTALNSQVRVQSRAGAVRSTVALGQFWPSVGGGAAFDPRLLYDPYGQRWIFVACADRRSASAAVLIAVSQTADPTGGWHLYRVAADPAGLAWADFPSVGFNRNWIGVQVNLYNNADPAFDRARVWAFDKADLYGGGDGRYTAFDLPGLGGTLVPATTRDPAEPRLFFLQSWNGNASGQGYLRLYALTGTPGLEQFDSVGFVASERPWANVANGTAELGPQLGSAARIQVNDARMRSLEFRNGTLWAAQTVLLPANAPTYSAVQWWQLATDAALLQEGRIEDPLGQVSYAFPSLAVNRAGGVLIGYSRFSPSAYAAAYYSYRTATDPAGALRPQRLLKAGEASYYKTFGVTANRWGDYSATVVDPLNDLDFWTIQEYAAARAGGYDRWGTWWGRVPAANTAPTLAAMGTLTINEDAIVGPLALALADDETPIEALSLAGHSSNPALVPDANITFAMDAAGPTVTVSPLPDQWGQATLTITASDDSLSATQSFDLVVEPVNDPPAIGVARELYLNNDGASATIRLTLSDVDSPPEALTLEAAAFDAALLPADGLALAGAGPAWTVTLTPTAGAAGSATLTLAASDGALTTTQPVAVHIGRLADLALSNSDGLDAARPGQTITYTIVVTNHGPNPVSGAVLAEALPAEFGPPAWSCSASASANCPLGALADDTLDPAIDLPSGGVLTYTVSGRLGGPAGTLVANTVSVQAPSSHLDPPGNNTATDLTAVGPRLFLPIMARR